MRISRGFGSGSRNCGTAACCCCAVATLPTEFSSGAYLETDFASMIAWRDWDFPDKAIRNCFPMAALRSSDGAFLLGQMGAHTATAGQIYFAAGTPDRNDIVGDTVDLEGGVMRELTEETGLSVADVSPEPGWFATPLGQRIALMKVVQARETATALRERIRAFLASSGTARAFRYSCGARRGRPASEHAALCGGVPERSASLALARRAPAA